MRVFFGLALFCVTFVVNAQTLGNTYKRSSIGFEISNPHNLKWFEPEFKEQILADREAELGEEKKKLLRQKLLLGMGFEEGGFSEGMIAVNVVYDVDTKKPLRYHLGGLLKELEKRVPGGAEIIGDYEKIKVDGQKAIYFKGDEVPHSEERKKLVTVKAHLIGFYSRNNLMFIQSAVAVKPDVDSEISEKVFDKFSTIIMDTLGTVVLN